METSKTTPWLRHFHPRALGFWLLVALALRLAFISWGFPNLQTRWNLREDGDNYGAIAQSIREGNYSDITRGPVYPAFLAVAGLPITAKILQALLDTVTCALIFFLARRRWWASALWAVYPFAIWRVAFINKEIMLTFLLTAYVLAQLTALERGNLWRWILAGALLGIVNLCKPTFLFFPVIVIAILAVRWWRATEAAPFKQILSHAVALIVAMLVVIAPWTLRNYYVTNGEFLPVAIEQGGVTTFIGNYQPSRGLWEGENKPLWQAAVQEIRKKNPEASAVELDRVYYRAALDQVASNPVVALQMFVQKCGRFWFISAARRELAATIVIQTLYLSLAAFGLWKLRRERFGQPLLLAVIGYVMFTHALSYADVRFSLIVMPLVCALAGNCGTPMPGAKTAERWVRV